MEKLKISLMQSFAMLVGVVVGGGFLNLTDPLTREVKQEAWIASLFGGIAMLVFVNIALSLLKTYPGQDIFQIAQNLLGSIIGLGVKVLFFIYFTLLGAVSLRVAADVFSSWILPKTPLEVIAVSFVVVTFYLVRNGLQVVARFSEVILLIMFPFVLLLILPIGHWHLINLLPIGTQPIVNYLKGSLQSTYSYLGFEIILLFYPYIQGSKKKVNWTVNLAVLFVIIIYTVLVLGVVAAMGPENLSNNIYSTIKYSQFVKIPIIERVSFLLTFFWIFALFHTFGIFYYFGYHCYTKLVPPSWQKWGLLLGIPIYYLAFLPDNIAEVGFYVNYISLGSLIFLFVVLLVLKLISVIKKRSSS